MRIITWNCNMAFRKKAAAILAHRPDVLVVPECEHPARLVFDENVPKPTDVLWTGTNESKGLAVFSYGDFRLKKIRIHNPAFRYILPVRVSGPIAFTLFAVWANNPSDPDGTYVEQVWKAIHYYNKHITRKQTVLAGDFNSNTIWDRKYRVGNHSHVVEKLARKKIESVYHRYHGQLHGAELHPTQFMYRHRDKPYHLDYCFASKDLADRITSVEIGAHEEWARLSDHVPLITQFED